MDWSTTGRVLDIGAGDGWFASQLASTIWPGGSIVCWDVNYTEDDLREPLPENVARTSTPPAGKFDLVLLLDVLEHIEDDGGFLDDHVTPHLDLAGVAIITVPAHPALYVEHDRALAHVRRYAPAALCELVGARYEIVADGGLVRVTAGTPGCQHVLAERLGKHTTSAGVGEWTHGHGVTTMLTRTLDADARLGYWFSRHGRTLPGLTTWIVAQPRAITHVTTADVAPTVVIVPCYNEERRLDGALVMDLCRLTGGHVLLVDDGSTDRTVHRLVQLAGSEPDRLHVLELAVTRGQSGGGAARDPRRFRVASGACGVL